MGVKTRNLSNTAGIDIEWQGVQTGNFTAVAGKGYFVNTTSTAITVTLPASPSFGDTIIINDYASTFATNNVAINPNGNKIEADTSNGTLSTNDQTHTLVYTDSTQGWKIINQDTASSIQPTFITATGGTVTESGDYKIHTFTGDGCFVVSQIGGGGPIDGPSTVDYLVVAGGGGGGDGGTGEGGGGAGAGGFRESHSTCNSGCYTASPLATPTGITVTTSTYPITVGAGGTPGIAAGIPVPTSASTSGSNSIFSTITSTGGGYGASGGAQSGLAGTGGSGGGGNGRCGPGTPGNSTGQAGNTPPTSPPQGNSGGNGQPSPGNRGGGGGGATAGGGNAACNPGTGGVGGAGATTSISGSPTAYAGGGGGANQGCSSPTGGAGGTGGGGPGGKNEPAPGRAGTANTGGGGGGNSCGQNAPTTGLGGQGGKGIVIIRYKFQ